VTDTTVFWVIPFLLLFVTWLGCGLAGMTKDAKDFWWAWPLPLVGVLLFHWFNLENRCSLRSFWADPDWRHIGYYQALLEYGSSWQLWCNFGMLAFNAFAVLSTILVCFGVVAVPREKAKE